METFDFEELVFKISKMSKPNDKMVIGIDGADGAGKSALAKKISEKLSCTIISFDDYLKKPNGHYVTNLDFGKIQQAINNALQEKSDFLILEGVCLLKILKAINVKQSIGIYVKRISTDNTWLDYDVCDITIPLENAFQRIARFEKSERKFGIGNFHREISKYHHEFLPLEKMDIIFCRICE